MSAFARALFFGMAAVALGAGSSWAGEAPMQEQAAGDPALAKKALAKKIESLIDPEWKNAKGNADRLVDALNLCNPTWRALRNSFTVFDDRKLQFSVDGNAMLYGEGGKLVSICLCAHYGGELFDLAPLAGLPLRDLRLEWANVSDLSPLRGMALQSLTFVNRSATRLSDIEVLRGMPLKQLNLGLTLVRSLEPLKGCPLRSLWLHSTQVADLSPLQGMPLEEVFLDESPVEDLSPLVGMKLSRLSFKDTPAEKKWRVVDRQLVRIEATEK